MTKFQQFKESYFLYSFKRDKVAMTSFIILVILLTLAVIAPWIAPMDRSRTSRPCTKICERSHSAWPLPG